MGYYEAHSCPLCNSKKNKKVKVKTVCFEKTVQSINDLIISAPIGIDIDDCTGRLNSKTHIEILSKPCFSANLDCNVLIIEGLLHIKIIFENPKPCPCTDEPKSVCQEVFIPIQAVISMNDSHTRGNNSCNFNCDDTFSVETKSKVISTSIFGYPNKNTTVAGKQINLIVKAVLEITAYIFEEEIIELSYNGSRYDKC